MISVVIPTLGGGSLYQIINSLNQGEIKPFEIIICIPESYVKSLKKIKYDNVYILETKSTGQVSQRAEGFILAKSKYVLQLDDDVIFEKDTLSKLKKSLDSLGLRNVVAPLYFDTSFSRTSHHKQYQGVFRFLALLYGYFFCGASLNIKKRMGSITKLGIAYGLDAKFYDESLIKVDWLSGGCILGFKDDLINNSFYPYHGKAYCEDILHSINRTNKGIKHYISSDAVVFTPFDKYKFKMQDFLNEIKIRFYIASILEANRVRLSVWIMTEFLKRLVISSINTFRK